MKNLQTLIILIFSGSFLFAQNQTIEITGKVIESSSGEPIALASVMIEDKTTKELITGVTTEMDGTFKVETDSKDFNIKISFIGLNNKTIS